MSTNIEDIRDFVKVIETIVAKRSNDFMTSIMIQLTKAFVDNHQNKEIVSRSFSNWIQKTHTAISKRDEKIFNIQTEGELSIVFSQIATLWLTLDDLDKETIWLSLTRLV